MTNTTLEPRVPKRGLTLARRQAIWAYVFLFVPLLFFLIVRLYPALESLRLSLLDYRSPLTENPFIGIENFQTMLSDTVLHRALLNTGLYALIGVPIQLALGLGIAMLLQQVNTARGVYRAIYFAPYVTPIVASAWVWQWLLNRNFGPVNAFLGLFGIPAQPFLGSPDQALVSAAALVIWQQLGFQIVIFLAGLEGIPRVYYEAASLDGVTPWTRFRYITLPLLNATLVFSVVIATNGFLQLFAQVANLNPTDQGGPLDSTLTVALYIYRMAFQSSKMGYAAAITVLLFAIILVLTVIQLRVLRRRVEY
ncbi:MAG: sugar ABC transporter permease [Pleurocapsa sp. SU_196_0]|nr:sugar ABC transporter permease [Pleurocapsa sp. SU_196_0]